VLGSDPGQRCRLAGAQHLCSRRSSGACCNTRIGVVPRKR
jgi:hypothetical protein